MEYKIINPKQDKLRAFYRIYILPRHIEIRKGQNKKVLEDEVAEHLEWVKENKLGNELKAYIKTAQARQDAYDKAAKLRGELSVLRGTDMNRLELDEIEAHAKELMAKAKELDATEATLAAAREAFDSTYGNPAGVASATVSKG